MKTAPAKFFVGEAREVLLGVRKSLADLVISAGADPTQPAEIARRCGIDKSLSWRVTRIICESNTWSAARHIPGKTGLQIFVRAMERCGAPNERAESVRMAMDRFEQFVETHSGDRETFELMLGNVSEDLLQRRNAALRKNAYLSNSGIWGVQARAQVTLQFVAPDKNGERLDFATITGLVDFRRLRADARWSVATLMNYREDAPRNEDISQSIFSGLGEDGSPLLRQFCSDPAPKIEEIPAPDGRIRHEFAEGPVGNSNAATCVLGWNSRSSESRYRTSSDTFGEHLNYWYTPVETVYHDLYIHESLTHAIPPQHFLYSQMPGGPIFPHDRRDRGLLPTFDPVIDMGASPPDSTVTGLLQMQDMAEYGAASLERRIDEFHGYRMRMRHPPIPTLSVFRYTLPDSV